MQFYCDDEKNIFIGVCSVDLSENKIIKKVAKAIDLDFIVTTDPPEELLPHDLGFDVDTIVVSAKDYNEDFATLSENGIAIYIIPW